MDFEVLAIVGPTAVGKSAVAMELGRRLSAEIVSADSMQVYQGMDIGTAKPTAAERAAVAHHLLDLVSPTENFSVAEYANLAHFAIDHIRKKGRVPLVVGGSGLYVRAALDRLNFPVGRLGSPVRAALERRAEEEGGPELYRELARKDPEAAGRIHPNNTRRVVRALEVIETTGRPFSDWTRAWDRREFRVPTLLFGLTMDRSRLSARIESRIDGQIEEGLVDEVARMFGPGETKHGTARQALGYRELADHLAGKTTREEAVRLFKQRTRRFARRQLTWFRRDPRVRWVEATNMTAAEAAKEILDRSGSEDETGRASEDAG